MPSHISYGHGFQANQEIIIILGAHEQLNDDTYDDEADCPFILGYDLQKDTFVFQEFECATQGEIDHYYKIYLNNDMVHPLVCSSEQLLYAVEINDFVNAAEIPIGTHLKSYTNTEVSVSDKEYIQEPITVHNITVDSTHTFFVGHHQILAHNFDPSYLCNGRSAMCGQNTTPVRQRSYASHRRSRRSHWRAL